MGRFMANWFKGLPTKWQVAVLAIGALFILGVLGAIFDEPETPNPTQTVGTESSQDANPAGNVTTTPQPTPKIIPTRVTEIIATPTSRPTPFAQPSEELTPTFSVSDSGCDGDSYDRDQWEPSRSKWTTARQATAREEGPELVGYWTGLSIASLSEADIDHHVPLKHAHMAGGCHWSESQRNAFYTDLDNLNVTTQSMNRSKSDRAPGHWDRQNEFIDTPDERCEYAVQWVNVKRKYELHFITTRETAELTDMLGDCGEMTDSLAPTSTGASASTATPRPATANPGEVKVYKNCAELRKDYPNGITKAEHPEVYATNEKRDRDKDGSACEVESPIPLTPVYSATPTATVTPNPPRSIAPVVPGNVKVYKNCEELRKDYPNGITKAEHPEVYAANEGRDRDKDGSACEVESPISLTPVYSATPTPTATPSPPRSIAPVVPGNVKVYKNCTELRKDYPNGITKAEHPQVYAANEGRDRDKDGSACE